MMNAHFDGVELGAAVGLLAIVWVFASLFAYLLWYRFLRERIAKITSPILKAAMIVAFAVLVALVMFALFFSQTHSSFEATYRFPLDLTYDYLSG
ncbi:MAG: hypothetical protein V1875_06705 [Candidatus Altiarchaeota archaeon]